MITSVQQQFIGKINRVTFDDEYDYRMAVELLTIIERHFGECYSRFFVEWLQQKIKTTDDEINLRISDTFEKSNIEYKVGHKAYTDFFTNEDFKVKEELPDFVVSKTTYAGKEVPLITLLNPRKNIIEIIRKLEDKDNIVLVDETVRTGLCHADKNKRFFLYIIKEDAIEKIGNPQGVYRFIKDADRELYKAKNYLGNSYLYEYELNLIKETEV